MNDLGKEGLEQKEIAIFPVIVNTDMTLDFPGLIEFLMKNSRKRLKPRFIESEIISV